MNECKFGVIIHKICAEQHNTAFYFPYKFSGKEKDDETQYSYFGARYYESNYSIFLGVDRYADKYLNLNPYHYCAWNPINRIDINGDSIIDGNGNVVVVTIFLDKNDQYRVIYQFSNNTSDEVKLEFENNAGRLFKEMVKTKTGRESIKSANSSTEYLHYTVSPEIRYDENGEIVGGTTTALKGDKKGSQITIYEGSAKHWIEKSWNQNKLTIEQKMATNAGHETYHGTNPTDIYVRRVLMRPLTNKEHQGAYEVGNNMSFEFGILNGAYD